MGRGGVDPQRKEEGRKKREKRASGEKQLRFEVAVMPKEQGAKQGRDVQSVRIGIGEYAYLVVSQIVEIGTARVDAERNEPIDRHDVPTLSGRVYRIHAITIQRTRVDAELDEQRAAQVLSETAATH